MDNKQTHVLLYLISLTGKSVMFTLCEWLFQYCFLYFCMGHLEHSEATEVTQGLLAGSQVIPV